LSTYSKIFARNLRRARRAQGLTQRELADSLCYSEKAVCKWESGECIPPAEVILMICARLYVSFDELFDQNTSAGYLLGFDGGSIKTEIVLTDLNERVIKSATIGSSALNNLNCAETLTRIDVAIKELTDGIAFRRISAFFGLCTATRAEKDRIHSFLESYNFAHIGIGSDIDNSIAAALGDEDGIAVNIGAGSSVFSRRGTNIYITGGYSDFIGDAGSAYNIGKEMLSAVIKEADLCAPHTLLTDMLEEHLGTPIKKATVSSFRTKEKIVISNLAPLVFRAYSEGDATARDIIVSNYRELANSIATGAKKSRFKGEVKAVLVGGLCAHADVIIPLLSDFISEIQDLPCRINISVTEKKPVFGAVSIAHSYLSQK